MFTDGSIYDADIGLYFTGLGYTLCDEVRSESATGVWTVLVLEHWKAPCVVWHTHSK